MCEKKMQQYFETEDYAGKWLITFHIESNKIALKSFFR